MATLLAAVCTSTYLVSLATTRHLAAVYTYLVLWVGGRSVWLGRVWYFILAQICEGGNSGLVVFRALVTRVCIHLTDN